MHVIKAWKEPKYNNKYFFGVNQSFDWGHLKATLVASVFPAKQVSDERQLEKYLRDLSGGRSF